MNGRGTTAVAALAALVAVAVLQGEITQAQDRAAPIFAPSRTVMTEPECLPTRAWMDNPACYEPTVASDSKGRIFVTSAGGPIAVTEDEGSTFVHRSVPPPPVDAVVYGDPLLQIDRQDRLVYSRCLLTGIQFAISDDGGATWDVNTIVPRGASVLADRQWIAFGPGDVVHVFWRTMSQRFWSSTSDDGGATFGAPVAFLPGRITFTIGQPSVDADGRVYVPTVLGGVGELGTIALAISPQEISRESFEIHAVARDRSTTFPALALDASGGLSVAWNGAPGPENPLQEFTATWMDGGAMAAKVSRSVDRGTTWSAPVMLGNRRGGVPGPWVARHAAYDDVLWFTERDELAISRGFADGEPRSETVIATTTTGPNTDFAHLATLPDGRLVVVWTDRGVHIAIEA